LYPFLPKFRKKINKYYNILFFCKFRCIGLDKEEDIINNGCNYEYNEEGKLVSNVPSTFQVAVMCGQIFNPSFDGSALDGLPIVFSQKLECKFLIKISIFDPNIDFWSKFRFLIKTSIFYQNFDFWPKFRFLNKISIFDQNFDFWPKLRFFSKISIFDHNLNLSQNFDFWPRFQFLPQFRFLTEISISTPISISDSKFFFSFWSNPNYWDM